ncbi:Choriogenin Hminor [Pleurostoma richardsiae]|uniref:Choriogenin Hminor n=1 Tax=Pleurostoma richardsiae TaxID=41990 RepID=A0AA38RJQ7_9PEZI|nr:Choriogenin Hminor [Pleurostoma richardsiae]
MSKGHTAAWIISPDSQVDYNTASLVNGEKVPELWNENGAVYVYMHPRGSGHGPSFKVPIEAIASSRVFNDLIQAEQSSPSARSGSRSFGDQLSVHDATRITLSPPDSPPLPEGEWRLYVPSSLIPDGKAPQVNQTASPSLERLVAIRNLFAFLMRQPLIGTKAHPSAFAAFLQIASLLAEFEFSSFDGVSYGEEADISFASFIEQLALADVRHSREKTIEALILGEQMRSWDLYNEAFTHAVGKYGYILDIKSPLFGKVSASTRQRLERANLDLQNRQQNVNIRLEEFDFPSLFAGVANSTSNDAYKSVRFKNWRTSFLKMRSFILGYYKDLFGNWPPKARSKKNPFSESGLNRLVLKALYADLCSLYDLLVDREAITPRVIDQLHEYSESESANPHISALRQMLSEFDASSPPVLPPIPFDVPKIPTMASVMATYDELSPKEQARFDRKLQPHELLLVLHKSYNFDTDSLETPFLMEFKDYDLKESKGTSSGDMLDHRIGTWLFLYVVIQSLPMLVVDAPGLKFTEGVEYFLCEPPQGNLPWMEDAGEVRKAWYQVPGQGIVELSADVIMYSVEATYNRSHCWLAAKQWEATGGSVPAIAPPPALSPLEAPRPVFQDMDAVGSPPSMSMDGGRRGSSSSLALRPRNASPDAGQAYRASVASIGLEPLPVPEGMPVDRRASRVLNGPFGLEPLPVPEGMPIDRRASRVYSGPFGDELSPYARPVSMAMPRSRSAGNLNAMMQEAAPQQQQQQNESKGRQASLGGSTFDDILKDLDNQKKPKKRFGF